MCERALDTDWAELIQSHAQRLAAGDSGPYDRYLVSGADGSWIEVTEQVQERARALGWTGP